MYTPLLTLSKIRQIPNPSLHLSQEPSILKHPSHSGIPTWVSRYGRHHVPSRALRNPSLLRTIKPTQHNQATNAAPNRPHTVRSTDVYHRVRRPDHSIGTAYPSQFSVE